MDHRELSEILLERSYHERDPKRDSPFVLASGKESWHYFECQKTTSFAPALPLIGRAFFDRLQPEIAAVGGGSAPLGSRHPTGAL